MATTLNRPRPWRLRRLTLVSGLLLIVAIGTFAAWQWRQYLVQEAQLRDAIAAVERTDPRWQLDQIEADRARLHDDENSAPLIRRLRTVTPRADPFDPATEERNRLLEANLSPAVRLTDEQYRTAVDALEEVEPSVRLYLRLARFPRGRHPITYAADGVSTLLSHVDAINAAHYRVGRFLTLVSAHEGDAGTALIACAASLNLCRSVGDEPVLITQSIRNRWRIQFARDLERTLGQTEPPADGLAALQASVAEEAEFPSWAVGLRGDRAFVHHTITAIRERNARRSHVQRLLTTPGSRPNPLESARDWLGDRFTADLRADEVWLLHFLTDLLADANRPLHEQAPLVRDRMATLSAAPAFTRLLWNHIDLVKTFRLHQLGQTRMRCTAVALAIERHRLAYGTWPATLADLPPELLKSVPLDPFDGKPLRYRRLADGVVVYSVGPDGTDDGGDLTDSNEPEPGRDIGFRLWDVDKRRQPLAAEPPRAAP